MDELHGLARMFFFVRFAFIFLGFGLLLRFSGLQGSVLSLLLFFLSFGVLLRFPGLQGSVLSVS